MENNKLEYEKASIEIVTLLPSDVISTSNPYGFDGEDFNIEW